MDEQYTSQPAEAVAWRSLALGALVFRGLIELQQPGADAAIIASSENYMRNLLFWLTHQKVAGHQAESERRHFRNALGGWPSGDAAGVIWQVEGLGALMWALGKLEALPPFDRPVRIEEVMEQVPLFEPVAEFVEGAALRPVGEIRTACDLAEVWAWRASLPADTPIEVIRHAAEVLAEEGHITPFDDDFPALGRPFHRLSSSEQAQLSAIAAQRFHALSWACGLRPDWDFQQTSEGDTTP